jgi:hypothetical protein
MKRIISFLPVFVFFVSCNTAEQKQPSTSTDRKEDIRRTTAPSINQYAPVDVSPMDMSYFPVDYPKLKMAKQTTSLPLARVIYSRPHLQGRHIFKEVLKYGDAWRLGANESTELDIYKETKIAGKPVHPGRYVLYCIPQPDKWTIILNSNIDSWGLEPDPTKDIASFSVPVSTVANSLEYFTMVFEKTSSGADLLMAWDNVEARLPISF